MAVARPRRDRPEAAPNVLWAMGRENPGYQIHWQFLSETQNAHMLCGCKWRAGFTTASSTEWPTHQDRIGLERELLDSDEMSRFGLQRTARMPTDSRPFAAHSATSVTMRLHRMGFLS